MKVLLGYVKKSKRGTLVNKSSTSNEAMKYRSDLGSSTISYMYIRIYVCVAPHEKYNFDRSLLNCNTVYILKKNSKVLVCDVYDTEN